MAFCTLAVKRMAIERRLNMLVKHVSASPIKRRSVLLVSWAVSNDAGLGRGDLLKPSCARDNTTRRMILHCQKHLVARPAFALDNDCSFIVSARYFRFCVNQNRCDFIRTFIEECGIVVYIVTVAIITYAAQNKGEECFTYHRTTNSKNPQPQFCIVIRDKLSFS
jgi:hypothetical protein